ncbi:MAG: hypothetical protein R3B13_09570 [Polyangiaceae bacterium]
MFPRVWVVFLAVCATCACVSREPNPAHPPAAAASVIVAAPTAAQAEAPPPVAAVVAVDSVPERDEPPCSLAGATSEDLNGDGTADRLTVTGATGLTECRAVDLNADGQMDVVEVYDSRGLLLKRWSDFDFDGHWDEVRHFEAGRLQRIERDLDGDGSFESTEPN